MTRLTYAVLFVLFLSACAAPEPEAHFEWFEYSGQDSMYMQLDAGSDEYRNPILAGFYPDPSMVRAGDDYYMVNSSFAYFPGLPTFHSTDLVNWRQIGNAIDRPEQFDFEGLGISRGVFAPTIRYHDDTFYLICTFVDAGGNFLLTATDPTGPWSDPVFLPFDGIDPSMFFDDDGRVYITNNGPPDYEPLYSGHRAIWIQEFDLQANELIGPRKVIVDGGVDLSEEPIWIEAPHIFEVDSTYYLFAAEGGTAEQHSEVVFTSVTPMGPYEPMPVNPILTQRHLDPDRPNPVTTAGHADLVQLPNGNWWTVFLATRPYLDNHYNIGRETFLHPMEWRGDQPIILSRDETVPYVHERPDLPLGEKPDIPMNGNFTLRENFDGTELAPYWLFVRDHDSDADAAWHRLDDGLHIRPRAMPLEGPGQPSFVGRRQQHIRATASIRLDVTELRTGDRAGLIAFQNPEFYYFIAIRRTDVGSFVELERSAGEGGPDIVAESPLAGDETALELRVRAQGATYVFGYRLPDGEWNPLGHEQDGTILSTKSAGGFVGVILGMYATTEAAE